MNTRWLTLVSGMLLLVGCTSQTPPRSAAVMVPVTTVDSVTGTWTGLLEMAGSQDRADFVELTVDPSGAYRVTSARTIGLLDAGGKVAVGDGKLRLDGERGARATATLYTESASPQRTLVVDGATPSGRAFSAKLRQ
jgi:hypothetical protein